MRKSARLRSRVLAAPIVITIGAAAGCGAAPVEPPHPNPPAPPTVVHGNPPPPHVEVPPAPSEPIHVNPPPPKREP